MYGETTGAVQVSRMALCGICMVKYGGGVLLQWVVGVD